MHSQASGTVIALAILALCLLQSGVTQMRPIPPGIRAADQAQQKSDQNLEPPSAPVVKRPTAAQLMQQADELLALAQQVQVSTQHVAQQGTLDKDLHEKLKRMEKLSKQLRNELTY